jgi:hypothetical protein
VVRVEPGHGVMGPREPRVEWANVDEGVVPVSEASLLRGKGVARRARALAAALLCLGSVAGWAQAAHAADVCDAKCDADCETCCRTWTLRAVCSDGTTTDQTGGFPTMREAVNATTSSPPPEHHCADKRPATWRAYCGPESAAPSPLDGPAAVRLVALEVSVAERLHDVREVQESLYTFGEKRLLNKAGQQRIGDVAAQLRKARFDVYLALSMVVQAKRRGEPTDADVAGLDQSTKDARQRADDAVGAAHALQADATIIDLPAEARQQRISASLAADQARAAAEKARLDEAKRERDQGEARRRASADEAEATRKAAVADAQQKRQATIAAAAKQAEETRATAAQAAARQAEAAREAEADRQRAATAQASQNFQSAYDTTVAMAKGDLSLCSDTIAGLTMVDMQSSASKETKQRALSIRAQLENEKDKLREVLTRAFAAKNKQPVSAAFQDIVAAKASAQSLHQETAVLVASAHSVHP